MRPIHIYWHIAQLNHWREVVDAQLIKLKQSGLYDASTTINAVMLGSEDYIFPPKIHTIRAANPGVYEFPTLTLLWDHAIKGVNDVVLYFHTKGVSHGKNPRSSRWRKLMESCLIDNWATCVEKLRDYATVGIEFRTKPEWHYSGNFWWSTREHLATLPRPFLDSNRWQAEMWVLSNHPRFSTVLQHGLELSINNAKPAFWNDYDEYLQRVLEAGSDNLAVFGGTYEGGLHLQQRPEELATFLYNFKDLKINTLWEIGAAAGGLARFFKDFYKIENVIIVDDKKHYKAFLCDSILPERTEFVGDSHSLECKEWLSKQPKPELVVIDGDHHYEGIKQDLELCLGLVDKGTIICLHDSIACEGVGRVVSELSNDKVEIIFNTGDIGPWADGLGWLVLRVK